MRTARRWWMVFAAGVTALVGVLLWLSAAVLSAERADLAARAEAERLAAIRLSLWRLDAWLGGFLTREATRSHLDYRAMQAGQAGSSPLAGFESDYIRLHFQVDGAGRWTSPQAPSVVPWSDLKDLADAFKVDPLNIDPLAIELLSVGPLEARPPESSVIEDRLVEAQSRLDRRFDDPGWPGSAPELSRRAAAGAQCRLPSEALPSVDDPEAARLGPLIPLWLDDSPISGERGPEFLFVRRVEWRDEILYQGFLGRWQALRSALLVEISDLLPQADLRPLTVDVSMSSGTPGSTVLATLPATLHVDPATPTPVGWNVALSKLVAIWTAAVIAILAVGLTLRASIGFGRRRQRFAAAMAHELRTPLTTFCMYTEMLADGTINDPEQRREYLDILQEESHRLSGLVEHVLLHAGLEERSASNRRQRLGVAELLESITPALDRHARDAGFQLEVEDRSSADTVVMVDVELVERMLFNLVDNACKYAAQASNATIHLTAGIAERDLILRVRDHGPGIPKALRHEIFAPFSRGDQARGNQSRGTQASGDQKPVFQSGAGLGLALVRDSARASGGDLVLDASSEDGACFELRLPALGRLPGRALRPAR